MSQLISFEDNVKMIYEEAAKRILLHTPLLFVPSDKKPVSVQPFGSGVLYQNDGHFYLFTAAHCVRQDGNLIQTGILNSAGTLHLLKGKVVMELGEEEKTDIAVIDLSDESASVCLESYKFLNHNDILFDQPEEEETDYLIVGHPISKTIIDHKRRKIRREPFVLISKSKNSKVYEKLNYSNQL